MKKLLSTLSLLLFFVCFSYSQGIEPEYTVSFRLTYTHPHSANSACTNFYFKIYFEGESTPSDFSTSWSLGTNRVIENSLNFPVSKKIERIEFGATRKITQNSCNGSRRSANRSLTTEVKGKYNYYRRYTNSDNILADAIFTEDLIISIKPVVQLLDSQGNRLTTTQIGCVETGGISLTASYEDGFGEVYKYEFYDPYNGKYELNEDYLSNTRALFLAYESFIEFLIDLNSVDLYSCGFPKDSFVAAKRALCILRRDDPYEYDYFLDIMELEIGDKDEDDEVPYDIDEEIRLLDNLMIAYDDLLSCFADQADYSGLPRGTRNTYDDHNREVSRLHREVVGDFRNRKIFVKKGWTRLTNSSDPNTTVPFNALFPVPTPRNGQAPGVREEAINSPISIRISSYVNERTSGARLPITLVQSQTISLLYLPDPPAISTTPEIIQPTCSYSDDANFSIVFDRELNSNEQLDLTIEKLASNQDPLPNESEPLYLGSEDNFRATVNERYAIEVANDPAIGTGNPNYDASRRRYQWNRPLKAGQYVMRVAGFERGKKESSPQCREFFYFFEVAAPNKVTFSATKQDQRCFGRNDGSIQITASGGSGRYDYIINGNDWSRAQSFTLAQSPLTIANLPAGTYNVQVRDSNGCFDKQNIEDANKVVGLQINTKSQIAHTINSSATNPIHPGAPNARDGQIIVASLSGGTPREDISGAYFDYRVLLNGSTAGPTGRAYLSNGFTINGLPAGEHSIEYRDANNCTLTLNLPSLNDPAPITYRLEQTSPSCADANDGELRIITIRGGYPPYNVVWTRNGTILPTNTQTLTGDNATYTLRITDARSGQASQNNIRFNAVPAPITFTESVGEITCFGGVAQVQINATGGRPPFQYGVTEGSTTTWYNSNVFELPPSLIGYRFRVRQIANTACVTEFSRRYSISQPEEFYIDAINVTDNTIFEDNKGAIGIEVVGSNGPYTVDWVKQGRPSFSATGAAISNLTAGYYIPTVTESTTNCTIQGTPIFVDEPEELIVRVDAQTDRILCLGDLGGLIANTTGGSENYSYAWYTNGSLIPNTNATSVTGLQEGEYRVEVNDGYTTATATGRLIEPEQLNLSVRSTAVSCFNGQDGTIVLQPEGGTTPYAVSIDERQTYVPVSDLTAQTLERLRAGTYQVWLRDANACEIAEAQQITVLQPSEIVIAEVALIDVSTRGGNDGSLEIEVTGGTGDYTIVWQREDDANFTANSTQLSNLFFGLYTASVTDENNCEVQRQFSIRQPLPMRVAISEEKAVLCHADATGEVLATVTGGYPIESTPADFEYRWYLVENTTLIPLNTDVSQNRWTGLTAGVYRVDVNDAKGVSATTTFEITQPDDLTANLDGLPVDVLCHGAATGRIAIAVTGGPKDVVTGNYLPYTYRWSKVEDANYSATTEDISTITAGTYEVTVTDANLCAVTINNIIVKQPEAPLEIASVSVQNLTGFETGNGSIQVDIQGGTQPYTYDWTQLENPSFSADTPILTQLDRGTYLLTVTDAHSCSVSLAQPITEPELLVTAIRSLSLEESVQCHGTRTEQPLVTVTTGGVAPYTYKWTLADTPTEVLYTTANSPLVTAGIYTVEVTDANANVAFSTYRVEEPNALVIDAEIRHLLCHNDTDGAIDITVSGGVPPYTYQWTNGARTEDLSNLRAGAYTVTLQDANGCVLERTIDVLHPRALVASVDRVFPSAAGLSDGSITLNIFGGTQPYSYQWRDSSGAVVAQTQNILNDTGIEKYAVTVTDANNCILVINDVDLFEPPVLEVSIAEIAVISCFGNTTTGRLTAVVEGGIPFNAEKQYDYEWFNADTNTPVGDDAELLTSVGAGNYYLRVTDVLRTTTTSTVFNFEEPALLEVALEADFINCGDQNDWTVNALIQGGTPPYQYLWNTQASTNTLSAVTAGTYRLDIIDQRGCTAFAEITTTAPPALTANSSVTNPTCYAGCDGRIRLDVAGGSPPYAYLWSNGSTAKDLSNACAGVYTVVVTDRKGCTIETTRTIVNPEQRIINLGEDITLCKDQTIELDATITDANASYQWTSDNGFTASTASVVLSETGHYTVRVTDAKGCVASDTIFIQATTQAIYTDFIGNSQVFVGEKFLLFDISEPLPNTLAWVFPEGATVHYQDSDYAELSFDAPGSYEMHMEATFGLCLETRTKKIVVVEREFDAAATGDTPTLELAKRATLKTYPNPATNGRFTLEVNLPEPQAVSLKVYGVGSNVALDVKTGKGEAAYKFEYYLSQLPTGLYFILFETESGDQVHKLIIE